MREDIEKEIKMLEESQYVDYARLADLYIVLDHRKRSRSVSSGTPFLKAVDGKDITSVLGIADELMEAVKVLSPKLYDNVMTRISEL